MLKQLKTIVFFGSGPVAAKSLELLSRNFEIEAVITKPKKSNTKRSVPVIEIAEKLKLKVYTASSKKELDSIFDQSPFKSQIGILIDFGIIVSNKVINYFTLGIINSHFSLLPNWRGADPISFSILNGENTTGVSLMILSEGIDEGNLIAQEKIPLKTQNSVELTDQLIKLSDKMLKDKIPSYISNKIKPYPQLAETPITYSRKLTKQDGTIDWNKTANQILNEIRAYIEWPKSYTDIYSIPVIITKAEINNTVGNPGHITFDKKSMLIYCSDGSLDILKVKPLGKNEMDISAFIAGYQKKFKY
jgi:methionyl-tRNA formyltransferase